MKGIVKRGLAIILSVVFMACLIPAIEVRAEEFSTGEVKGNVYENEFFGIRLTLPDGYSFVDEKALAQLSGQTATLLKDHEATAQAIKDGSVIIFAYANDDDTGYNSINVTLSNLGDASITEEEVAVASRDELGSFFLENGYTLDHIEAKPKKVAGENHYELALDASIDGFKFYEQVVTLVKDGYNMNITAATYFKDDTDEILKGVAKLK